MPNATDILVKTSHPEALDVLIQPFKASLLYNSHSPDFRLHDGCYVLRCFSDPDFLTLLIEKEGYGTVVKRLPQPL